MPSPPMPPPSGTTSAPSFLREDFFVALFFLVVFFLTGIDSVVEVSASATVGVSGSPIITVSALISAFGVSTCAV